MKKKILVTAGSTSVLIDQVRSISNIFKGRTGTDIAVALCEAGAEVTLITSNFGFIIKALKKSSARQEQMKIITYKTFVDLHIAMEQEIKTGEYDVIIHSAAVSDYNVSEVCIMENEKLVSIDRSKKVSSSHGDLFLHLTPTPKLVDLIREPWDFKGFLIKFKLQVGITDEELIAIAKKSRADSQADMVVANCLEWSSDRAYIITETDEIFVNRDGLGKAIIEILDDIPEPPKKIHNQTETT